MNFNKSSWNTGTIALVLASLSMIAPQDGRADFPFVSQKAEIDPPGTLTLDIGVGYREKPRDFGIPDRDSQWNIGTTRLSASLGELVEVQATAVLIQRIDTANDTQTDFGDWLLGTKIRLLTEGEKRPAIAMLWEVKLPIASNDKGGGTDETDFFSYFLFSKNFGARNRLDATLGVGLLGDPTDNSGQDDVIIVRAAWRNQFSDKTVLGLEALADIGFEDDDSPAYVRGIFERTTGRWAIGLGVSVGLNNDSDDYRIDLNFRRQFRLWNAGN